MIDLHCHYLPGVDDGPRDAEQAIGLATLAFERGITHAVLTPHVYPGVFDNTLETLHTEFAVFRERLESAGVPLTVSLGAEVRLLPECLELADRHQLPTIGCWGDDRVLLLEFPDGQIPVGTEKAVEYLRARRYLPLIAHPERNKAVMEDWRRLKPLLEAGCLTQLTAASVTGAFGASARRSALQLLDAGVVTVIASDAHNAKHRPPLLAEARAEVAARYGEAVADALTRVTPGRIIGVEMDSGNAEAVAAAGLPA